MITAFICDLHLTSTTSSPLHLPPCAGVFTLATITWCRDGCAYTVTLCERWVESHACWCIYPAAANSCCCQIKPERVISVVALQNKSIRPSRQWPSKMSSSQKSGKAQIIPICKQHILSIKLFKHWFHHLIKYTENTQWSIHIVIKLTFFSIFKRNNLLVPKEAATFH